MTDPFVQTFYNYLIGMSILFGIVFFILIVRVVCKKWCCPEHSLEEKERLIKALEEGYSNS